MLIVFKKDHTHPQLEKVRQEVIKSGCKPHVLSGLYKVTINVLGDDSKLRPEDFKKFEGVEDVIMVGRPFKLVGRDFHPKNTEINVKGVAIGSDRFVVIAGPCAVESEEQTLRIAKAVKKAGADILRGGAFKPRSSLYSFQGLALEGLKILKRVGEKVGLPIITEAVDQSSLALVNDYADIIQIGTRNMQNFQLLHAVGQLKKPVMIKRGMSATIDEWLQAAEYIMNGGNDKIILCERGIRSFDSQYTRNVVDFSAIPVVQKLSHLPVFVDPSHGTGRPDIVKPMTLASLAIGANGVMIDVHDAPEQALCDGAQAIHPYELSEIMNQLKKLARPPGRGLA